MWPLTRGARAQKAAAAKEAALVAAISADIEAGKLPPSTDAAELAKAVATTEVGLSGTTNYQGDILGEANDALASWQARYGQAGTREWGAYEEMLRTDPAVSKAVEFTAAQLRDARVDVEEAPEEVMPNRALAKAQADFVRWNLLQALEPGWPEVIQQMTRGPLVYGFSLHEHVFAPCQHPALPGGAGYRIAKLAERLPSAVHPNGWLEDERGELRAVRQQGPKPGALTAWTTVEVPASKLLLVSWNRDGNNYLGRSAFRSVYHHAKVRRMLIKLAGVSLAREGAGIPIAEVDKEASLEPKQREELVKLLANLVMHENASLVGPKGVTFKWLYSPAANKGHVLDAYDRLGLEILGQVQAQQIALGLADTGSRAVGSIHDQVANAFAQGVCATLEQVLNGVGQRPYTGLVRRLVDANWGPQPAYPALRLTLRQAKLAASEYAAAVKAMRDGKAITVWRLQDENASRERVGLAPITAEEFTGVDPAAPTDAAAGVGAGAEKAQDTALNGAQVQAAQAIVESVATGKLPRETGIAMLVEFFNIAQERAEALMSNVGNGFAPTAPPVQTPPPPAGEPSQTEPPRPGNETRTQARRMRAARTGPFVPSRPLRATEQHLDLTGIAGFLEKSKAAFEAGAKPLIAELLKKARPGVQAAMVDGDPSEVASLDLDLAALDVFIGKYLAAARAEGERQLKEERAKQRKLKAAAGEEDDRYKPSEPGEQESRGDTVLAAQRKQLVRRMEARLRADIEATALDVVRTNGDADEVVDEVLQHQADSGALRSDAGGVTMRAFNLGRADFMARYGDEVEGVEYSAVLDENCCPACEALDGEAFDFGSAGYEENQPPNRECEGRGNCRCLYVVQFREAGFSDDGDDEGADE